MPNGNRESAPALEQSPGGQNGARSELESVVHEATKPLKDLASDTLRDQSSVGADRLGTVANAVKEIAPKLEQDMPQLASSVRSAAGWLEKSAEQVRQQKFDEMIGSFGDFARKQPGVAFGVAALAGFALSRFLKSKSPIQSATDTVH